MPDITDRILDAALLHVPFDGWSEPSFRAAVADAGVDRVVAQGLFPRGAVDLAVAYHKRGDVEMLRRIAVADLAEMRFRDRVSFAVRARIEAAEDREVVRRGTTLFALPPYAPDGARLIWGTADAIWTALGDTSRDFNWYTKRATLSAVYSSTVLYWLGDDSLGSDATWAFLDRRIEDVMRFEKAKGQLRENRLFGALTAGPAKILERIKAPSGVDADLPGGTPPR
ncbi:COQ9 family protein [Antarctobacter heliothermus]|uniref:Ubiquinone biosynthesis protein COQ9 n=1 Tax=Antarctobacter heliothermus TaxID=74033 RepID=A0A239C232_9RHOB|nr:COQ9 family protein [Antarctobacter heliothermus]SNS13433.1 ubiquinone biosynthesis protein COQ9 [Antarctobacter heliothermus]